MDYDYLNMLFSSYIAISVVYGLLLGIILFYGAIKKQWYPHIHLAIVATSGIITHALVIRPVILKSNITQSTIGNSFVILLFTSIQYLAMFLIPIQVAHQQSKLLKKNNHKKHKTASVLAKTGYFFAFIVIVLVIVSLVYLGMRFGGNTYNNVSIYSYLHLIHTLLHWILILIWLILTISLRREIPCNGSFAAFGSFLVLMMGAVTARLYFGSPGLMLGSSTPFWVLFFLYHVCCFIAILIGIYFGPRWVQALPSENFEPIT